MVVERVGVDRVRDRLANLGKRKLDLGQNANDQEKQQSPKPAAVPQTTTIEEITKRLDQEEQNAKTSLWRKRDQKKKNKRAAENPQSGNFMEGDFGVKKELEKIIGGGGGGDAEK